MSGATESEEMEEIEDAENAASHTLWVDEEHAGQRLDRFLASQLPEFSRSRLQGLIAQGQLWREGTEPHHARQAVCDAAAKTRAGECYVLIVPQAATSQLVARNIPLSIIYEDAHLLVIDKSAGMTVHPAPGHADDTLVNALLAHCGGSLSGIGGVARPGIVHRIDKDTTGLLVVAKHDTAHAALSAQLADRTLSRVYCAVAWGVPSPTKGTITGNIGRSPHHRQKMALLKRGGREAATHYRVEEVFFHRGTPVASLLECRLETGRTHQIRVHCTSIGHPLIGDPLYGSPQTKREKILGVSFARQALHAKELSFIHPMDNQLMHFAAPLPEDLTELIGLLRGLKDAQ